MKKKAVNFFPAKDTKIGNKFILQEFIDEGSFGSVWKSVNLETNEIIALKIPKDQEKSDRTLSEGKEIVGCAHPNVIIIKWMGRVDGVFVIEMEYFPGHKLSDELSDKGLKNPRTFKQVFNIYIKILQGLLFIHNKNIVHGDIKPQNILISGDEIKITDFGTSRFVDDVFVNTTDGAGTWSYMAPEVAGTNKRYLNSDIYSMGVLLYQLLSGRTPHSSPLQVLNNDVYPKLKEINNNIPDSIDKIVNNALKRSPKERYQNLKDLLNDLEQATLKWDDEVVTPGRELKEKAISQDWLEEILSLIQNKSYAEAELLLKNIIDKNHTSQDALYYLSLVYYKLNRYFDSMKVINNIKFDMIEKIRLRDFEDSVLDLKGKIFIEQKNFEKAILMYEKLFAKNQESLEYKYKLACSYALNAQENKAIILLEQMNKETPGILAIIKKLGHAYDQNKDYSKARGYFNYAIRLDPYDETIKNRLEIFKKYLLESA